MTELPPMAIVPMRRRHLPEVLAIEAAAQPHPWSRRLFEGELGRPARCYLVARIGTEVVGFGGVLAMADDGHISTLAVHPAHRRQGVARRLLVELVRGARDLGARQLTLEVRASNQAAQALYRSFGFAPGGVRPAYYADNREDALVMWAHEVDSDAYARRLQALAGSDRSPSPGVAHPALAARRGEGS